MTQPHQIDREAVALLPCPFCGDAPKIESDAGETLIYCVNDQCIIFTRAPAPYNDYGHRASAIAAWNRRPAMEAVAWRWRWPDTNKWHYADYNLHPEAEEVQALALIATHPVQGGEG